MRKAISFTDSSSPSLLRWIRSTVRIQELRVASYLIGSKGRSSLLWFGDRFDRHWRSDGNGGFHPRERETYLDRQPVRGRLPVQKLWFETPLLKGLHGATLQAQAQERSHRLHAHRRALPVNLQGKPCGSFEPGLASLLRVCRLRPREDCRARYRRGPRLRFGRRWIQMGDLSCDRTRGKIHRSPNQLQGAGNRNWQSRLHARVETPALDHSDGFRS